MATFVAMCPYCRAGGVRAPHGAVGASATCPRCKSNFTVVPSDDAPAAQPPAETRPAPALTEPSPVLPAAPPVPLPSALAGALPDAPAAPLLPVLSLMLFGPSVLATQLPHGRAWALAGAGVGLLLALAGFGAGRRGPVWAGCAAVLHACAAAAVLALPAWFGLAPREGGPPPDLPPGPFAVNDFEGTARPLAGGEWVNAPREVWAYGDLRASVDLALGPVELFGPHGARRTSREPHLVLRVVMVNGGPHEVPLVGWIAGAGRAPSVLANGKTLAPSAFPNGWGLAPDAPAPVLAPGEAVERRFAFAPPRAATVSVVLDGTTPGAPDVARFRATVREGPNRSPAP